MGRNGVNDLHLYIHGSILYFGKWVSSDFFGSSRGLRQRDPLSPMLFLVKMEVFKRMLKRVEGAGLISGFKADGRRGDGICGADPPYKDATTMFSSYDQLEG